MARHLIILLTVSVMLPPVPAAFGEVTNSGRTIPDPFEPASVASAQPRLIVTATELMQRNHLLEVEAGTEVVWAAPWFERVWFQLHPGVPRVERTEEGFRAVFEQPGTYRGLFTLAGWRPGDLYQMTVIVKGGAP